VGLRELGGFELFVCAVIWGEGGYPCDADAVLGIGRSCARFACDLGLAACPEWTNLLHGRMIELPLWETNVG